MIKAPAPTEVELRSADEELRVVWEDGRASAYPLRYLRGFCPCANCQGHGGGELLFVEPPSPLTLDKIEAVGNYAIGLNWNDGHSSGIYSWEVLRELCPSDEARTEQGEAHAMNRYPAIH